MDASKRAQHIGLFITDIDGVWTDGSIYYNDQGNESKAFNITDGIGIQLLQRYMPIAVITGRKDSSLQKRLSELNITHVFAGTRNKQRAYAELKTQFQFTDAQIAYIGDDLPDLGVMRQVGLAIAVDNACAEIKAVAHYCTRTVGGKGAVREACEFILKAQAHWPACIESYA